MADNLQLQIQGSTNFAFSLSGEFTPSIEPVYKEAANPPEVRELRNVWTFEGCRIVPTDGTQSALWTSVSAFLAYFSVRAAHPTYVRMVRDPDGTPVTVWTLGPPTYEQLRFELLEGQRDPDVPAVTWLRTATFTLRVSAVSKLPHAVTGLTGFTQRVEVDYGEAGLRELAWVCRFETKEGTSALTKAQAYGAIDLALLPTYSYLTNGPDGFTYEILDPDEIEAPLDGDGNPTLPARVPTIVETVCRVREWGVVIGASGPGTAPGSVRVNESTEITADETVTIKTASATGPNAVQFVASQALSGGLRRNLVERSDSHNEASGYWERSIPRGQSAQQAASEISVVISGGAQVIDVRLIPNGYPPVIQRGACQAYRAAVSVTVRRTGGLGTVEELPFPAALGAPWVLDGETLKETEPEIDGDPASDPAQTRWVRKLDAEFVSSEKPQTRPLAEIRAASPVPTYVLA